MPTYEYACRACGNELEAQQRIVEPALKTCPACGKDELERLISRTSFQLKGGGWYKDLYASAGAAPARTDNDRTDRLQKAISDDKAKSAAPAASGEASSASAAPAASSTAAASSGGGSDSGSSSGSSGGGSASPA